MPLVCEDFIFTGNRDFQGGRQCWLQAQHVFLLSAGLHHAYDVLAAYYDYCEHATTTVADATSATHVLRC